VSVAQLSRDERHLIARRRLMKNLGSLTVASMRTLEMKIADAGPPGMRVDPHIITAARNELIEEGLVVRKQAIWYHRADADTQAVADKLTTLIPLHDRTAAQPFTMRLGQTLEIAVFKALNESNLHFVGGFPDLDGHDDSALYSKEEPPRAFSNRRMPGERRFDFLAFHSSGPIGIEAKNIREWLYPDREEVRDLLHKAAVADTVPVLIGRRIPYVTFRLLWACGALLFENFNQLYPWSDAALAADVQQKDNLGYHDVRVGSDPNPRLLKFVTETLDAKAEQARERFNQYRDLIEEFGSGEMDYASFAARIRRRENNQPEGFDEPEPDWDPTDLIG
jgi:hypothetical protein